MKDINNEALEEQLKRSLNHLEEAIKIKVPGIGQIRQLVSKVEERKQKRLRYETLVFLLTVLTIMCVEVITFKMSLALFICLQFGALTLLLVYGAAFQYRKHKEVKET